MSPSATMAGGESRSMRWPSNQISPLRARSRPDSALLSVVLPTPLLPSTATISPGATSRSMPRSTSVSP